MWWQTLKLGVKSLLLHKLRSLLTMLGVILGVGSVIAMLAIGEGSKREALERIRRLGASNVIIRSVKPNQENSDEDSSDEQSSSRVIEYGLRYKDLVRLKATIPTIERAVPITLVRKRAQAMHRAIPNARILGTTPDYLDVKNLKVGRGRFLSDADMTRGSNVTVLAASGVHLRAASCRIPIARTLNPLISRSCRQCSGCWMSWNPSSAPITTSSRNVPRNPSSINPRT
jgi:putative ABC transport system permease protein